MVPPRMKLITSASAQGGDHSFRLCVHREVQMLAQSGDRKDPLEAMEEEFALVAVVRLWFRNTL